MTDLETNRDSSTVAWSCVLDDTPALWRHFLVWIATLMDCANVRAEGIVVHHVTELRPDILALTERLGVRTKLIPRFDVRSPHSNKISQCLTDFGSASRVVLTDVDLAFITRPPLERIKSAIAGKLVDYPNPPIEVLTDIFDQAGLTAPQLKLAFFVESDEANPFQTFAANYNGGFYVIDATVLADLGKAWMRWARWLLAREIIPASWAVHVDQISFCMAVQELGLATQEVDLAWNLPSHVPTLGGDAPPFIVHHHGQLDPALGLLPLQPPRHETQIAAANIAISQFLRRHDASPLA